MKENLKLEYFGKAVRISSDLHDYCKIKAAKTNRKLQEIIDEILRPAIEREQKKQKQ